MEKLKDLMKEVCKISQGIDTLLYKSQYKEYADLCAFDIDYDDADEVFLYKELSSIMDKLSDVKDAIEYINRPVIGTYTLHKNKNGRYECEAMEFTSGTGIEFLLFTGFNDCYEWVGSRVEHNGEDYYIVGYPDVRLENLKIRIRRRE